MRRVRSARSSSFLAAAEATDLLLDMSGQTQGSLGLHIGDVIEINGRRTGADPLSNDTFTVADDTTYQDLVDWVKSSHGTMLATSVIGQVSITAPVPKSLRTSTTPIPRSSM